MTETTPFFVGWGTLTLINAGLAQAKGRSGLGWWLLSLLLGPIATLLIVVLPPADQKNGPFNQHRSGARVTRAQQRSQT